MLQGLNENDDPVKNRLPPRTHYASETAGKTWGEIRIPESVSEVYRIIPEFHQNPRRLPIVQSLIGQSR